MRLTRRPARGHDRAPLPAGFGTIWSTVAVDLVGFGIVLPILPQYAERFGAGPATVGALFASFSVAQLLCAPLWGALSDRIGRKPVLVVSLVGTAVGSLVTGLAGSLPLLFAGRILDGASGASVSVAHAAVADLAPPRERARLFGLLGAAFGVGFVIGPALGGLAALGGVELPFLVAAAVAGVNAVLAVKRLPETRRPTDSVAAGDGPGDMPQMATGGPGTGAAGSPSFGAAAEAEVAYAAGVGGPGGRPADGAGAGGPSGGDTPGRGRELAGLLLIAFVSLLAFSAFEATFALFGERRLDLDPASTAAVFTGIGVALVVVQTRLVAPTVRRFGEMRTLQLALAVNAAGLLLLAPAHSWWVLVPALLALVVGQGLAMPSLTSAFSERASAKRRGGALGLQQSASGLARVLGPVAGGAAFQYVAVPAPYVGGAVLMVVCAALVASASAGP